MSGGIQRLAVIGAGVMGSEIAQVSAAAGLDVLVIDSFPEALEKGAAHIRTIGERRVERGRMSAEEAQAILDRVTFTGDDDGLAECDLAIEAIPEILDAKIEIFRRLDAGLPAGALIASNTSGLSISALAAETGRPSQVLGLHFFNPASVMRLVEVIQGEATSTETIAAGEAFATALGKSPVRVKECPGFLVNRILLRAMVEAYRHAAEIGADPPSVDAAVVAGGPATMGPFALGDLIGLDTVEHIRRDLETAYGERFKDGGTVAPLVADGRLGRKSGGGFFDTPPADAEADEPARAAGERYYLGALSEAHLCLAEGIAAAADVDVAMRYGCGWETGPLEWSRETGVERLAARMGELAGAAPRLAPPAALTA